MDLTKSKVAVTQGEWEDLAHLDPLWAVLSDNTMQFGRWDQAEFFASGQREIDALMRSCGLHHGDHGKVLDFGCGAGRLSRALLPYFGEVYGVDISEEMIRLAQEATPAAKFVLNTVENLRIFDDNFFDFVYSNIVLQHQRTKEIARSYIREFVRIVRPGGTAVFQVPTKMSLRDSLQPRRRLYSALKKMGVSTEFLYKRLHLSPMRTISLSPSDVQTTVSLCGGQLLRSTHDTFNRNSMSYIVSKSATPQLSDDEAAS